MSRMPVRARASCRGGNERSLTSLLLAVTLASCKRASDGSDRHEMRVTHALAKGKNDGKSDIARNASDIVVRYRRTRRNLVSDGARSKGHERA